MLIFIDRSSVWVLSLPGYRKTDFDQIGMDVKFIENFKTKAEFNEIKSKRRCWNKCHKCQTLWNDIETDHVHLIQHLDPEEFINGNGTFFVCDNCKPKIKES